MANSRIEPEAAAGKLIRAIQKEWRSEAGRSESVASKAVMHSAYDLRQASKSGSLATVIASGSVSSYLGQPMGSGASAWSPVLRRLKLRVEHQAVVGQYRPLASANLIRQCNSFVLQQSAASFYLSGCGASCSPSAGNF